MDLFTIQDGQAAREQRVKLAEELRRLRVEVLGMTQAELAAAIGLDWPYYIGRWESAKHKPPGHVMNLVRALARARKEGA